MLALITTFWNICCFRQGPQDLPSSRELMRGVLIFYTLMAVVMGLIVLEDEGKAVMSAVVYLILLFGAVRIVLSLADKTERMTQTITALAGVDVLINLLLLPLVLIHQSLGVDNASYPVNLMVVALMVWNLVIIAHIFRHALSAPFLMGVVVAMIYFIISSVVINILFVTPS